MRIGFQPRFRITNTNQREEFNNPLFSRLSFQALVQLKNFTDLLAHRMQRVERCHRLLKHHGDVIAAHFAQRLIIRFQQINAIEQHFPRRMRRGRIG